MSQIYVLAKEDTPFWQPTPPPNGEEFEQYHMKCKFGRFGTTPATYVNKTAIICLTPNINTAPQNFKTETVDLTVAMNGVDFNDDYSDATMTFIGTGTGMNAWIMVMGVTTLVLLLLAVCVFLFGYKTFRAAKETELDSHN